MPYRRLLPALLAAALPLGASADPSAAPSAVAPPTTAPAAGLTVGMPAPAFSVKTLDGKTVGLENYRGKTLVINVWATWCPPCREEMPELMTSAPKYAKDGTVAFLGVDTTEQAPIVRAYAAAKNVPYPLALGTDASFGRAYDIQAFPTTFVIDANGILRARYVDTLAPRQLAELVAAGKAGRNAAIVSPLQSKIDASLADPAIAFTSSDPAVIEANAKAADAAIDRAEKMLDDSDAAAGNSTDFFRTRAEEAALRDRAVAALVNVGTSVTDKSLLPRMSGDAALEGERWSDALDAYRSVLAVDPKNEDALGGIAQASSRLKNYDAAVAADQQLTALAPDDATALVSLGLTQQEAGHAADAYATFDRAIALAKKHVDASHGKAGDVRMLAYVHMYAGRTYAKNGDTAHARAQFEEMLAWTQKLPANNPRHDMYLEEGQEAIAALGLVSPTGISVSLAPWIGADLPGSVPSTIKYRLVLAGTAGKNVTLEASGLPKAWVASFCSDKVCAPMRDAVVIPQSGVKIVEFQLIPPSGKPPAPKVRVTGHDGSSEASATT
ncbi:MAG: redoxin family protein [Candidatus Eremiobacteraeota bacterium]|nr:redoxin family protein [Candidatus Eremiobacteraeota bacterium]